MTNPDELLYNAKLTAKQMRHKAVAMDKVLELTKQIAEDKEFVEECEYQIHKLLDGRERRPIRNMNRKRRKRSWRLAQFDRR